MTENTGTRDTDVRDGSAPTNVPVLREGVASYLADSDPEETQEWMDSLDGLLAEAGPDRARYLMLRLLERARDLLPAEHAHAGGGADQRADRRRGERGAGAGEDRAGQVVPGQRPRGRRGGPGRAGGGHAPIMPQVESD